MDPKTEILKIWQEYKQRNDEALQQVEKFGAAQAELAESLKRIDARFDELEAKAQRPAAPSIITPSNDIAATAFGAYARKGLERLSIEEQKALVADDGASGGYLAPTAYVAELLKNIVEFSPVRAVARVIPISAQSVQMPKKTSDFTATWVAESGTRSETTGMAFGLEEIPTHELYARVDISNRLLEDSVFNLEAELNSEFAEQFGKAEGTAFISGNSVGKPEGLLTNSSVGEEVSGDSDEVTADGFIKLFYSVKSPYAENGRGTWMLNRNTLSKVRRLKESGSSGQYLWAPGFAENPNTILGRPYAIAPDMPSEGANEYPVLFGDFRRAYYIVDRIGLTLLRDPYSSAASGAVRFYARRRVGGQVVLPEAIKKLKCATS